MVNILFRLFRNKIQSLLVQERVRIWNEIYEHSSVRVVEDGNKLSHIVSIAAPKLEQIVLPKLPDWYECDSPEMVEIALKHPSMIGARGL